MDSHVEQLLPGEQIQFKARVQRAMFILPGILVLAGLVVFILSVSFPASFAVFIPPAGVVVFLIGASLFLWASFSYTTTEFAVTDRRILAKAGWPRSKSLEIGLQRVDSILLHQSLFGRVFNYGTLIVVGSGGTLQGFPNIVAAREFRSKIEERLTRHS